MFPVRDNITSRTVPFVNWALIVANCTVFVLELRWQFTLPEGALDEMIFRYGFVPGFYFQPSAFTEFFQNPPPIARLWHLTLPFFSYMFLHGGFFHLLLNMVCLYIFGDNVEDRLGHAAYFVFYLAGGVAAASLHLLTNSSSLLPTIGASGAIAAVMGAYLLMFPRAQVLTLIPIFCIFIYFIRIPAYIFLGIWFLLQFAAGLHGIGSTDVQGVAVWAHIGGFAFGVIMALLIGNQTRKGPPRYEVLETHPRPVINLRPYKSDMGD